MPDEAFTLIAYRGGAGERPENTLVAFEHALSLSAKIVIDLDLQVTADGAVVVIHDSTLERTTNGTGLVAEHSLAEITRLDAGYRFQASAGQLPYRGQGLEIPTLENVLKTFSAARFILDLRANDPSQVELVMRIVDDCRAADRVIIVSEHDAMIARFRRLRPQWRFGAPTNEVRKIVLASKVLLHSFVSAPASYFMIPESHGRLRVLTPRLLGELQRRNKRTWVWTINESDDARRLRDLGVDGIFTDYPARLLAALQ